MPEALTPPQLEQLRALADAGATRSERSKPIALLRPGNINVLGILKHHGLVATRQARGFAEYWLTAAGVAAVRDNHHIDRRDPPNG